MKVFIFILTLAEFIFVACQQHEKTELLKAIDSLIVKELYDSAYREVQLLDESFFKDESDRAHFHLLQIQTSYITMKPVPADSIINQNLIRMYTAVSFFGFPATCVIKLNDRVLI